MRTVRNGWYAYDDERYEFVNVEEFVNQLTNLCYRELELTNSLTLTLIFSSKKISIEISKPAVILFYFHKVKLKMKFFVHLSKQMKF